MRPAFAPPLLAAWLATAAAVSGCTSKSEAELVTQARASLQRGDAPAAIIDLKNALKQNPESGQARLTLGKALLAAGDPKLAMVELDKARELRVPDDEIVPPLAEALLTLGEGNRLIEQHAATRLTNPESVAVLKTALASAYAFRGDAERSRQAVDDALAAKPDHAPAMVVKARLLATAGDSASALNLLDAVLQADKANLPAGILKAELLARDLRDPVRSVAAYRQVLASHPNSIPARSALVNLLVLQKDAAAAKTELGELKRIAPAHPETHLRDAQMAFVEQDYQRARVAADNALKAAPKNARALELAGAAELRLGNFRQAEARLTGALKLVPQLPWARLLLAQTHLRLGEPNKALELLRSDLDAGKAGATVLSLAGEAHLQLGDAKRAASLYQQAVKAAPDNADVRTSAALAQLARGETATAVAELEALARMDQGPRANLALISVRLRDKDHAGALKAIDELERKMPGRALPHQLRGRVQLDRRDLPAATKAFEAALKAEPANFQAVAGLAAIDLVGSRPADARRRYNAFIEHNPGSWQAQLAIADLEERTHAPARTVEAALREAVRAGPAEPRPNVLLVDHLIRLGDGPAALLAAQQALAVLPKDVDVIDALGRAQLATREFVQATVTFKRLASLQPRMAEPELKLAEAYAGTKDLTAAAEALRRADKLQPNSPALQHAMVRVAMMAKKPGDALAVARGVQQQFPKSGRGYTMEGDIEQELGRLDAAQKAYRAAHQRDRTASSVAKLHQALLADGKKDEAAALESEWTKAHPQDAVLPFLLGDAARQRNDWARAEGYYRAVLAVAPNNAPAMNNLASMLVRQGKPGALALAEKADKLMPGNAAILDTVAMALEADGQVAKAIASQKRALELEPKDPSLMLRMARLQLKAGDKDAAREGLEALSKLGDRFVGHAEVASLMKSL